MGGYKKTSKRTSYKVRRFRIMSETYQMELTRDDLIVLITYMLKEAGEQTLGLSSFAERSRGSSTLGVIKEGLVERKISLAKIESLLEKVEVWE